MPLYPALCLSESIYACSRFYQWTLRGSSPQIPFKPRMRSPVSPLAEECARRHVQFLVFLFVGFAENCHLALGVFWV